MHRYFCFQLFSNYTCTISIIQYYLSRDHLSSCFCSNRVQLYNDMTKFQPSTLCQPITGQQTSEKIKTVMSFVECSSYHRTLVRRFQRRNLHGLGFTVENFKVEQSRLQFLSLNSCRRHRFKRRSCSSLQIREKKVESGESSGLCFSKGEEKFSSISAPLSSRRVTKASVAQLTKNLNLVGKLLSFEKARSKDLDPYFDDVCISLSFES